LCPPIPLNVQLQQVAVKSFSPTNASLGNSGCIVGSILVVDGDLVVSSPILQVLTMHSPNRWEGLTRGTSVQWEE
jgi:hypothetical protein